MLKFALTFVVALSIPTTAMAQSLVAAWPLVSPSRSLPIKIHTSVTSNCQIATNNAAAAWNATRSTVILLTPTTTSTRIPSLLSGDKTAAVEIGVINIQDEPGANFGSALMKTNMATTANGSTIVDANIYVRADYLYYATTAGRQSSTYTTGVGYDCPSPASTAPRANHYDYQTGMVHELGHTLGFGESTTGASTCPMWKSYGQGQSKRTVCGTETSALVMIYGSR